jgi:hypothetical protein
MPDTLAPPGLGAVVVTGSTVATVPVVVGAGAVVATVVVATVVAVVFEVVTAAEPPHPAAPNAAANKSTDIARIRGTRLPFEVPAESDWPAAH